MNKQIEIEQSFLETLDKQNKPNLTRQVSPNKKKPEIPQEILKEIDTIVSQKVRDVFPIRMVKIKDIKESSKDPEKRRQSLDLWLAKKKYEKQLKKQEIKKAKRVASFNK